MAKNALYAALLLALCAHIARAADGVYARDGFGKPVSWWVVLKLPMLSRSDPSSERISPTPCDCPPPDCSNLPTRAMNATARAAGLCYLYADSTNSSLQYFRALGYDCLGQGGNDPLSHTLRHIQPTKQDPSTTTAAKYWALFNDQLNGIAESLHPTEAGPRDTAQNKRICSGGDLFSAHAKGAVAFDGVDGGFFLQTSTPNFPDPSTVSEARGDRFIPLGCQRDNNVQFAQHMTAVSVGMADLDRLGKELQAARLCSGNFYHDLRDSLASASLLVDGAGSTNFSRVYRALLDPTIRVSDASTTIKLPLRQVPSDASSKPSTHTEVFHPLMKGETLLSRANQEPSTVTVTVKTPRATVPPWALLSEVLQSDLSVASWWDGGFGIPNICAGDMYLNATNQFCLGNATSGVSLNNNGSAKFNVENLIEAAWQLPSMGHKIRWHLVGGNRQDGNHAKWAITTPRYHAIEQAPCVTFADLNMEGFPCSKACNGSQAGRGGSFFSFTDTALHASLATSLITKACPCVPRADSEDPSSFVSLRMCRMGCWRKIEAHFQPEDLPVMTTDAASFWSP